ncbi:hypothetical protein BGW80DRAFT_421166 [Lactifluus volemus]|nr:hypothetical protein BGW80DRAFT_421166 [Lactifluus volemus]
MISKFEMRNTLPELQHEFCALWNEIVLEASKDSESHDHDFTERRIPFWVLRPIRHIYIALHQDTNAAPVAFDASTDDFDSILERLSSYPSCNIPSHHSASETAHPSSHPSPDLAHTPTIPLTVHSITVAPQHSTDIGSVPPSPTPGISLSPLPYTIPSSALPLALQSTLASTTSRIEQVTPGPGLLPSTSVTGVSSAPQEVTLIPQPNIAPSDATFNTHILSDIVEASQDLHQLTMSVQNTSPESDSEPLRHSVDTAPSYRDIDRPC